MKMLLVLALLSAAGVGLVAANKSPAADHHIVASTTSARYTIDMLLNSAETIAIVEPTGQDIVHWNSDDNSPWTSELPGRAMIYNDQEVKVIQLIRGNVPRMIKIRNIGGIVGNTEYELEGLEALEPGTQYLVFLRSFDTPTSDGFERAVSFVGQNQGIFLASDAGFVSNVGLRIAAADLTP